MSVAPGCLENVTDNPARPALWSHAKRHAVQ